MLAHDDAIRVDICRCCSNGAALMPARLINHVSVRALDLETSVRFYETLFGATRIATPYFGGILQWMKLGDAQIHIFQRGEGFDRDAHFAVEVDDFVAVYRKARELGAFDTKGNWNHHLFEIPSGEVQLYLRDPADNLVEVVWPDAQTAARRHQERHRAPRRQISADRREPEGELFCLSVLRCPRAHRYRNTSECMLPEWANGAVSARCPRWRGCKP